MPELLEFPARGTHEAAPTQDDEALARLVGSDAHARDQALDVRRSFIVEAPAGSGKTGLLLQRLLRLLSEAASEPEEVLAITFTRKATAELRERVFAQLEAAAANTPLRAPESPFEQSTRAFAEAVLRRDRERGWGLLENPRRVRIQTIDSLSIEIASALPLLSGVALRTPVDDASELYRQAARNTLLQLGGPDHELHDALHLVLLHRDGNLSDVERLLAEMLARREQWAELVPLNRASLTDEGLDSEVRPRLERTLESLVCAGLTRALRALPAHAWSELASLAHDNAGEPGYRDAPNPFQLCHEHPGPPAAEAAHLDHWHALIQLVLTGSCDWRKSFAHNHLGVKLSKADKERLASLIASMQCEPLREALEDVRALPPARYPDDQWRHAKALFRLLLHGLAELQLLFAESGQCDFTQFSLAARQALAGHADDYARSSGVTLQHLLVDEVQDTSSAQYELLTALTRSWDGSSQTLFLVGDPKQSIYLFRQARVERFLRTAHDGRLGDVPLTSLRLTANFRSRPAVVDGVNESFERLFLKPDAPLAPDVADVPFVSATPIRSGEAHTGVQWHARVLPPKEQGEASQAAAPEQQDAAVMRAIVEEWRRKPLPPERQAGPQRSVRPWRIAVLANARSHLATVAAEFRRDDAERRPIPYRAIRVEALGDRPEVLDAFALLRALAHPADRAAWFAVLRAPWCGLDAADLLLLAAEADAALAKSTVPQLIRDRSLLLSADGQARLQSAWSILQPALERSSTNGSTDNAQRTWISLGADVWLQPSEKGNVERLFSLAAEEQSRGTLDFHRLKQRLKELYAEPSQVDDAVELTTIHQAKGLEWDVVLVPALQRPGQRDGSRLLNWLELETGSEPSVLLAPIYGRGEEPSPLYRWLSKVHTRRVEAERKRVFYVACTRAREELHLFATAQTVGRGEANRLSAPAGSLLHACWPAAEPHFAGIEREVSNSPDADGTRVLAWPETGVPLALAAVADAAARRFVPRLTRLPAHFDRQERFRRAAAQRLPYLMAAELPQELVMARPEGSVRVRALGNVVHRFLDHFAVRLRDQEPDDLAAELPSWLERLTASLRAEGLATAEARVQAGTALKLLSQTMHDPDGRWLLAPHADAASEQALAGPAGLLRVDRTFLAGETPGTADTHTRWVVDFKTTEPGGRDLDAFLAEQREWYGPQLARYAEALRAEQAGARLVLALYFPAIPRLVYWAG